MHGVRAEDRRQHTFQESVLSFYLLRQSPEMVKYCWWGCARLLKEGFVSEAGNGPCLPHSTGMELTYFSEEQVAFSIYYLFAAEPEEKD